MDRLFLVASTFCFLFGFGWAMHSLGARVFRAWWWNFSAIVAGFVGQMGFLYLRGQMVGRCPLTNGFEILAFLAWALVIFYFVTGSTYRVSLLGAFTAPAAFLIQAVALLWPGLDVPARGPRPAPDAWMELHAALSVLSFGAFALAAVAGVMYLVQERQLKSQQPGSLFYQLPPIRALATVGKRLIAVGLALLTVGLACGFRLGNWNAHALWPFAVWLLYAGILAGNSAHRLSPRRAAWMAVAGFAVALGTLWGVYAIESGGAH